jgi:hypothetical protein
MIVYVVYTQTSEYRIQGIFECSDKAKNKLKQLRSRLKRTHNRSDDCGIDIWSTIK